jgi:hypothetical protein
MLHVGLEISLYAARFSYDVLRIHVLFLVWIEIKQDFCYSSSNLSYSGKLLLIKQYTCLHRPICCIVIDKHMNIFYETIWTVENYYILEFVETGLRFRCAYCLHHHGVVCQFLRDYTTQHPRSQSSHSLSWEAEISLKEVLSALCTQCIDEHIDTICLSFSFISETAKRIKKFGVQYTTLSRYTSFQCN